jgi:2-hydroxy-3-keto-5-methylthiopentenyl-1-phosphate phosphatase
MPKSSNAGPVLVSDFDGTMTRHDFYRLAIEKLLPRHASDHWAEYRSGKITHFEALRRYFAAIRKDEDEVLAVARQMELAIRLAPTMKEGFFTVLSRPARISEAERYLTDDPILARCFAD